MIRNLILFALLVQLSIQARHEEAIEVKPGGNGLGNVDLSQTSLSNDFCEATNKKCDGTVFFTKFTPTLQNCIALCRRDLKCVAINYDRANGKKCHLLSETCSTLEDAVDVSYYSRLHKGESCSSEYPKWEYNPPAMSNFFCLYKGKACPGRELYPKPQNIQPFMKCLQKCLKLPECVMVDFVNNQCDLKEEACSDDQLVDNAGSDNYIRLPEGQTSCPSNRVVPTEAPATTAAPTTKAPATEPPKKASDSLSLRTHCSKYSDSWKPIKITLRGSNGACNFILNPDKPKKEQIPTCSTFTRPLPSTCSNIGSVKKVTVANKAKEDYINVNWVSVKIGGSVYKGKCGNVCKIVSGRSSKTFKSSRTINMARV